MHWRTIVRTSAALRAAPVALVWILMYSGRMTGWITDGYWPSVAAQSSFLLSFTAPAVAACGAWEGLKVRRSDVLGTAPARSTTAIALSVLAPVLTLGTVSVLAALAIFVPQAGGTPGWPTAAIIAVELLVVLAHTAAGYALGLTLPRLLAVPFALVASFLWMAFPSTLDAFWVRQLNGRNLTECCALDEVPALRAVAAPTVAVLGLLAAAWIWTTLRDRRRLLAVVTLAATTAAGAWIAAPLGYRAATARPASEQTCTATTTPRVCLWPEQKADASNITEWATQAQQRLDAAGLTDSATVSPFSSRPGQDEVRSLVALGHIPDRPPQCARERGGRWLGAEAVGPLSSWLKLTAGVTPLTVQGRYREQELRIASQVMALPRDEQLAWFRSNADTLTRCDAKPALDPAQCHHPGTPSFEAARRSGGSGSDSFLPSLPAWSPASCWAAPRTR
ncbi:hypothetical protein GCM10010441_13170 [Kitasatospora paracochleata]|uniref:DUF7224 domain-containing protein n=1 Tax=Kitasatospora paracochleata TaxID=58354 RepID=A0ABT1JB28_9ACTN|nr:hypothetical protein [Kitasatospora paracochleata]MCP2314583.1 hypothetical protein [Kitasatospora paracochleata]